MECEYNSQCLEEYFNANKIRAQRAEIHFLRIVY